MSRLQLSLLGGFHVRSDGEPVTVPTRKAQALLAYLGLRPGQPHSRDKLAALLWGDRGDEQARDSLRHTLVELRKTLPDGPARLVADGRALSLDPAGVEVDVATFEQCVARGTAEALAEARELYRGDFLDGFALREAPFEEWLVTERERLRELALDGLRRLLEHQQRSRAIEPAIRTAARLVALDATLEVAHRALMRLYLQQGRRGAALRQYQSCVAILQREVGAEPELETRLLYQELVQRRDEPKPVRARSASPKSAAEPRERPRPGVRPDAVTVETPLIGRSTELDTLRHAFTEAEWGRGRVVAIVGEAGIGKSRLALELAVDVAHTGGVVLVGAAYASTQSLPFGPWADVVRTGHVIRDRAVLDGLDPVWKRELARLFPELGEPEVAPTADPAGAMRLFEAMAQLVAYLATDQPLLLVLEDLHWADEMSLRLLAFVAQRVRAARVLLVATIRQEELADSAVLRDVLEELDRARHLTTVNLRPLSREDTTALVQTLTRSPGDERLLPSLIAQAWLTSEGNPFMVVEMVRAVRQGVKPHPTGRLALPQRVREVISARLDRLAPRSRELVAVMAVIGHAFDFPLLCRAAELTEREAAEAVEELVRRRVLHGIGDGFDFTHDRIREVVYAELLPPRRKVLHAAVVAAFERLHAGTLEQHSATLAMHCRACHAWEHAARYGLLAARRALAASAPREAAVFCEGALDSLAHLGEASDRELKLDVYLELWTARFESGQYTSLPDLGTEIESLARSLRDGSRLAEVLVREAQGLWGIWPGPGTLERAVQLALEVPSVVNPTDLRTRGYAQFIAGAALRDLGHCREAIEAFDAGIGLFGDALDSSEATLARPVYVSLCAWRAEAHAALGEFDRALASAREAVRIADLAGGPSSRAIANAYLGYVHLLQGDVAVALPVLERGLAIAEEREPLHGLGFNLVFLGYALVLLGRREEGLSRLERALGMGRSMGLPLLQWRKYGTVTANAYLAAEQAERALAEITEGLALATSCNADGHRATLLRLRAEALMQSKPTDMSAAVGAWSESLALSTALDLRPESALAHLGLGKFHRRLGRLPDAARHLRAAAALLRDLDMRRWLQEAESEATALG